MNPQELTIHDAQRHQPWMVPYSQAVQHAAAIVDHIYANHAVLHAIKTLGKLATVFESLDHTGGLPLEEQKQVIAAMSADLVTAALRFANLYQFDLASVFVERVNEKNGGSLLEAIARGKE